MTKGMVLRLPDNVWRAFKHKLLDDGVTMQEWFTVKVLEYIRK